MPPEDELPSLWLYGETEPWRRGRTILITIGLFYATVHGLFFLAALLGGGLEIALVVAIALVIYWLAFAFI